VLSGGYQEAVVGTTDRGKIKFDVHISDFVGHGRTDFWIRLWYTWTAHYDALRLSAIRLDIAYLHGLCLSDAPLSIIDQASRTSRLQRSNCLPALCSTRSLCRVHLVLPSLQYPRNDTAYRSNDVVNLTVNSISISQRCANL
jgi:hypothetical protein